MYEKEIVLTGGHFVLNGWDHSSVYLDKEQLFFHHDVINEFARCIAFRWVGNRIVTVVGPGTRGFALALKVAEHMTMLEGSLVGPVQAIQVEDRFRFSVIGAGKLIARRNILIVDDVFTTGKTIRKLEKALEFTLGRIVGRAVMVCRNPDAPELDREDFQAVLTVDWPRWARKDCVQCRPEAEMGVDFHYGHGEEYNHIIAGHIPKPPDWQEA